MLPSATRGEINRKNRRLFLKYIQTEPSVSPYTYFHGKSLVSFENVHFIRSYMTKAGSFRLCTITGNFT